jgi:hypothetical protein
MISPRETLVLYAVAAGDGTGIFRSTHAMNRRLVALQVGEAGEVCGGGAGGYVTCPCSAWDQYMRGDVKGTKTDLVRLLLLVGPCEVGRSR